MKDIRAELAEHPFFAGLAEDYLDTIAGCGKKDVFTPGTEIAREGTSADYFYLIRKGRVAIETYAGPRGIVRLQTLDDGDILGWSWLFPPYLWNFDARALQDVRTITLDGACLRGKCDADPALGYALMKRFARIMSERLRAARIQLLDIYSGGTQ